MKFKFVLLFSVLILYSVPSFATIDITAVGGITQMTETITATGENYASTANTGKAYGALLSIHSMLGWGLTTGFLYSEVNMHVVLTGIVNTSGDGLVPYYQIPVLGTYWIGGVVGLGAGGYYALPGGNINVLGTTGSFSQQGYKGDDYGLAAGVQLRIPLGVITHVMLDAMYEYGLENVSTTANSTIKNQGFVALLGFGIGI
jgi:hypothetical protein